MACTLATSSRSLKGFTA